MMMCVMVIMLLWKRASMFVTVDGHVSTSCQAMRLAVRTRGLLEVDYGRCEWSRYPYFRSWLLSVFTSPGVLSGLREPQVGEPSSHSLTTTLSAHALH